MRFEFITNALKAQGTKAIYTFIDFKNAFPSVRWFAIEAALKSFHVPAKLINGILSMYESHKGFVKTADGDTEHFDITAGVLQGDTLAPYLFIIVLNEILRSAITATSTSVIQTSATDRVSSKHYHAPVAITDLNFADDIVLINTTESAAQHMLHKIQTEAAKAGLEINNKKTQNVIIGNWTPLTLALDGSTIQNVQRYRYLGRWTDHQYDLTVRIGAARRSMHKMRRVWQSTTLTNIHKAVLFKVITLPTLTYAMSTYPLNKSVLDRIRGATTRMLKKALNIPAAQHCTIEEIYCQGPVSIDLTPVLLYKQRMNLIGAALRIHDSALYKVFMLNYLFVTDDHTINNTVMNDLPALLKPHDIIALAQDPPTWKKFTNTALETIYADTVAEINASSASSKRHRPTSPLIEPLRAPVPQRHTSQLTLDHWLNFVPQQQLES